MRIAYLDAFAGVAGDMWVAALVDLGVDLEALRAAFVGLGLDGVSVRAEETRRAGFRAVRFAVDVPASGRPHRHLGDVLEIAQRADLPSAVADRVAAVFNALAEAEAAVHGQSVDAVHFHEVGADDTIVDVVGACLGLHLLGVERVYCSRVAVGSGTVRCAHGELPVPAPGTLRLLEGIPVLSGSLPGERTTPTGAALLRVLVDAFEPDLEWTPERSGHGAGSRDDAGGPNVLRVTLGRAATDPLEVADAGVPRTLSELTCNLDTATGETLGYLIEGAIERGAVDAWVAPVQMKKGRPGHVFAALVQDASRDAVVRFLLEESSTLGVRVHRVHREVLERWTETLDTELGPVRYKVARLPSGRLLRRPEDDELTRLASATGRGRREIEDALRRSR